MAFYEDALRQQVYHALLHAAEQVSANAYRADLRRNKGKPLKQFSPPVEARCWCDAAGRLHKMTDTEVEALMAEITTPTNLERRFTDGAARKL